MKRKNHGFGRRMNYKVNQKKYNENYDDVYEASEYDDIEYGEDEYYADEEGYYADDAEAGYYTDEAGYYADDAEAEEAGYYADDIEAEEAGYYADDIEAEEAGYYADDIEADEAGYYADDIEAEEEGYYADNIEANEVYADLAADEGMDTEVSQETMEFVPLGDEMLGAGGEYYEEENYDGSEEDGEYYYSDEYESDDDVYYEDELNDGWNRDFGRHENKFLAFFRSMTAMDRIVAATGAVVMAIVLMTCSVYASAKAVDAQVASFSEVGDRLDAIGVGGESGLVAMADAGLTSEEVDVLFEEETETETETEEEQEGEAIGFNMTSIEKDLKIKFVNSSTNRLVSGIPFEVEVTGPDKKTNIWVDDDKDGVIYKKNLTAGNYQVALKEIDALKNYKYYTGTQSVKVKDKIEYVKIDVIDEVKTEAEVNAAIEDTAIHPQEQAPALQDTVEWVESTKTPINGEGEGGATEGEYQEIEKKKITDPLTISAVKGNFLRMSRTVSDGDGAGGETETETPQNPWKVESVSLDASSVELTVNGGTHTLKAEVKLSGNTGDKPSTEVEWSTNHDKVVTVSGGILTPVGAGTAEVKAVSKADNSKSAVCTVTVKESELKLTLNPDVLGLKVGESSKVSPSISSGHEIEKTEWRTENDKVAAVDGNGNVKGVAAGETRVICKVTTKTNRTAEASVKVTVNNTDVKLKLDKSELTMFTETDVELKAAIEGTVNGDEIQWIVEDEDKDKEFVKVKASDDKKTGTVTAVEAGAAKVSIIAKRDGKEIVRDSCKITVRLNPKKDTVTKLKDNDGNQIYIKNKDGKFVEATLADYYTAEKFYILNKNVEYKYTGWQTLDGKTYYFTKDGKKVTGEQVIQGMKYNFDSDGALMKGSGNMGIDVSKWNGDIDWNAVKNSGVSYVIIRCGYRGSSSGAMIVDPKFKKNIQGASAAGLKVGIYFFSQAVNEVEAVEEASMTLSLMKGYKISYPVFIDIEGSGGRGDKIDKNTRTAVANAFCKTIQNGGYTAGIYANKTWFESKMNTGSLTGYKLWLAQYAAQPTYKATRYDMWQYTSKGKINGIKGNVDLNISYLGY